MRFSPLHRTTATALAAAAFALAAPGAASAAPWTEPFGPVSAPFTVSIPVPPVTSPIEVTPSASTVVVGGVPYVAWTELLGEFDEIHVARLNRETGRFEQPWSTASSGGINFARSDRAEHPRLADVNGVPYITWVEKDAVNNEIRVARLNTAGRWEQPWGALPGWGGLNRSTVLDGYQPAIASASGVPYVSWVEWNGKNKNLRVARLENEVWQQPWPNVDPKNGGVTPLATEDVFEPSITSVRGIPHVAWSGTDEDGYQVRVARLNLTTKAWSQPWAGRTATAGGVQRDPGRTGVEPSLTSVGGVAHIAWSERNPGRDYELRVARLEPRVGSDPGWTEIAAGADAMSGRINQTTGNHAFFPRLADIGGTPVVAWREGVTDATELRVARFDPAAKAFRQPADGASTGSGGIDGDASRETEIALTAVGGAPAVAWVAPDGPGARMRLSVLGPEPAAPAQPAADRRAPAVTRLSISSRTVRLRLSEAATVRISIARKRGERFVRLKTITRRGKAGSNVFKLGRRALGAGRYRVTVTASDPAGNRAKPRRTLLKVGKKRR